MAKRLLPLIALAITLTIAATWLPGWLQSGNALQLSTDPGCTITQSACSAGEPGRQITLSVEPTAIQSGIPLAFRVKLDGIKADSLMLSLEGKDMYMGINQSPLSAVEGEPGIWQGEAELALCTTGEMMWRARVIAVDANRPIEAHFEFSAR